MRTRRDPPSPARPAALAYWLFTLLMIAAFWVATPSRAQTGERSDEVEGAVVAQLNAQADSDEDANAADAGDDEEGDEGDEWRSYAEAALGWQGWSIDGNERRFRQYVTPDRGLYPYSIRLSARGPELENWLSLELRSISEPGRRLRFVFDDSADFVSLWGEYRRSEYFQVFTAGAGGLRREDFTAEGHLELGDDATLELDLFTVSGAGQNLSGPTHFSATTFSATPQVEMGDLMVRTSFTTEGFSPLRGREVSGDHRSVLVSLLPAYDHRHMLQGTFSASWTDLDSFRQDVRTQSAVLELTSLLTRSLVFEGSAYDHRVLDSITANSLEVQRTGGSGAFHYTGLPGLWVESGAEVSHVDYLERFQTRVDEPTVTNIWARAHYRPCSDLKLYGEYRKRSIDDVPNPTLNSLLSGPPVTWDDVERWEAKAVYSPSSRFSFTGRYRSEDWRNEPQRTASEARMAEASAWWMPWSKLTLYGSYQRLDWDINGVDGPIFYEFDYGSNANIYTAGGSYQVTPKDYVNVAGTYSSVLGASRSRYSYVSASWRHDWNPTCGFELNAVLDEFYDAPNAGALDYDADLFGGRVWHTF